MPHHVSDSHSLIEPVRDRRPRPLVGAVRHSSKAWPWWLAAAVCVALVAVSGGLWMDAKRSEREIPWMQQGLTLLALEREAGAAVGRLGLATMSEAFFDADYRDLPDERARAAEALRGVEDRLDTMEPLPHWGVTVGRLRETLDTGIRRLESREPMPEGAWAWQWAFTTSFSGVFPTDISGRFSGLLDFALGSQYGVYGPVSILELTLARWGEEGGPLAAHEGLRAYLEGDVARLEEILADTTLLDPFDPELSVEAAAEVGDDHAFALATLRADPRVRWVEVAYRDLRSPLTADLDPNAYFRATGEAIDALEAGAIELLAIAGSDLEQAALVARTRANRAVALGVLVSLVGLGLLGRWMMARGRIEGELRAAAERDALTGVHSRFSLFYHEEPRLARGDSKGVALMLTDMDDFKSINDRWGHTVGDGALREFAQACSQVVEEGDRVARIGGDEFVILLHDRKDPVQAAAIVAERIHANLAEPVEVEGVRLHLRATIGIAVGDGESGIDDMLLQADTALLDAKKNRRSRHAVFNRNYRRNLIREIDGALESGAIDPVFQPIVRASDQVLAGAELLARWTREDGSQVPLDALIDAMVSVGASGVWTERMLLAAARVTPFLPSRDIRFWLNVATHDLVGPGARALIDTLSTGPVPCTRLGIEVTERIPPSDLPEARSTLLTLRASGLAIALDDVGSDGVPLRHLTELPLDRVKLDGSLVREVDLCPAHRALLAGIVMSARDLDLEIVAEQVETEGEVRALVDLGVHYLQGYRTGAPVTIETFISAARREVQQAAV